MIVFTFFVKRSFAFRYKRQSGGKLIWYGCGSTITHADCIWY